MSNPLVCCLLLTADRQEMTDRAVRAFMAQTYAPRRLFIWDTGKAAYQAPPGTDYVGVRKTRNEVNTIGTLRNQAIEAMAFAPDIIVHWDSDDWSEADRLTVQVKHLLESKRAAVGFNSMLFWDARKSQAWIYRNTDPGYCVSTSLCYWRETWEQHRFPAFRVGAENHWLKPLNSEGWEGFTACITCGSVHPLTVAVVHGGNTVGDPIYPLATNPNGSQMWVRCPRWDFYCKTVLGGA